jgi:hypothetical protein
MQDDHCFVPFALAPLLGLTKGKLSFAPLGSKYQMKSEEQKGKQMSEE